MVFVCGRLRCGRAGGRVDSRLALCECKFLTGGGLWAGVPCRKVLIGGPAGPNDGWLAGSPRPSVRAYRYVIMCKMRSVWGPSAETSCNAEEYVPSAGMPALSAVRRDADTSRDDMVVCSERQARCCALCEEILITENAEACA